MKGTLFILFFLTLVPCHRPPVEVVEATARRILPGRPESPVRMRYEIKIVTKRSSDILAFDEIYVHGVPEDVEIYGWPEQKRVRAFSAGDTLLLRCYSMKSVTDQRRGTPSLPERFRGRELVIGCSVKKKQHYIAVERVLHLPDRIDL